MRPPLKYLLIPLACALSPIFLDRAQSLPAAYKLCAVGMDEFDEEDPVGFGVRRISGDRYMLAGLDGILCPTVIRQIEPAVEFDNPLFYLAGGVHRVEVHHGVRIYESELRHSAGH
jgi:hypothetical protein